ncbi:LysM peptidoglycan-binding domain-containing protein [Anaerocolumna sp. AGMB13025]|uniref:LysM peptidoglycan-binding domain-containing protein n=1 Tax=Anaerocolumna sp. AGMB13025 TaxID=3039116 RepID=UPI00241D7564|nr:LysM peptidoglycan-binding domain-containing protein [Anaerocolumna sp. AGMB13025]WFR58312.1 LysM peptidoglycan-binding domain-containing protein [Anaerocolumna sp. AGMB13025]
MYIHVVQPTDTIESIAASYGVSAASIILSNGLINPYNLVSGQSIVIAYPNQTYTVQEGDSLTGIAAAFQVPLMQLLRNNPFLSNREFIYPGETLIISYNTSGTITTNGFAYQYINLDTLRKTLPFLTYLSVYNYRATGQGGIASYYDDSELIRIAKEYGTLPLMLLTTLTIQGEPNLQIAFDILTNDTYQSHFIEETLTILKEKGFYGINIFFNYLTPDNQKIYDDFAVKLSDALKQEGYLLFITVNPNVSLTGTDISGQIADYTNIGSQVNNMTFLSLIWGTNNGPPLPVISLNVIDQFLNHVTAEVNPGVIDVGIPIIGYDWPLPYEAGVTVANALTINASLTLANDVDANIDFDINSQTPYFFYNEYSIDEPIEHIVRFVDARTIDALLNLKMVYDFRGIGVWNIMVFYEQLWLIINCQYEIVKLLSDQ